MKNEPYCFNLPKIGSKEVGYISFSENKSSLFRVERTYWTYQLNNKIVRGNHCHIKLEQILICMNGEIEVDVELKNSKKFKFIMDSPEVGLYLPPLSWHTMKYKKNAIQLVLASKDYNESDYIRNYHDFKKLEI